MSNWKTKMRRRGPEKILAVVITLMLVTIAAYGFQAGESAENPGGAVDFAPMTISALRALVAPIALYPDPLVAQVLAAATFPDQVAVANYWLEQHQQVTGQSLMQMVNGESWDASVKALTQFPSVLSNMANNLNWTSSLGEAYHNQPSEVMSAIQALRAQAKANGHLSSGPQMIVSQASPQTIVIEPADPQVVYVPQFDPATIYGIPYVTPGYTTAGVTAGSLLGFGTGVAVGALAGGCCAWGWGSWNTNWAGGAVVYNHNSFYGNAAWHGGYYNGGYRDSYGYHNAYNRAAANYRGYANRAADLNRAGPRDFGQSHEISTDSWARADDTFKNSNAWSGLSDQFGKGGWESRADSFRGWGSMHAGGFFGGRFGGGHFGGGGFRGGGFRR